MARDFLCFGVGRLLDFTRRHQGDLLRQRHGRLEEKELHKSSFLGHFWEFSLLRLLDWNLEHFR